MLLEGKMAVVYGAGGQIGGAVARAFAREGAAVQLAGRTLTTLDAVERDIARAGGSAATALVDAYDEAAVDRHLDELVREHGRVDVVFNALSYGDAQLPLLDVPAERFVRAVTNALTAQLQIGRAAARHMVKQRAGVILTITGYGPPHPGLGNTGVLWSAVEALCRQFACELGPHGVRVLWLRTGGSPESYLGDVASETSDREGAWTEGSGMTGEELLAWAEDQTMLKRLPPLAEVGDVAALLASDRAAPMTATAANVTSGAVAD